LVILLVKFYEIRWWMYEKIGLIGVIGLQTFASFFSTCGRNYPSYQRGASNYSYAGVISKYYSIIGIN
jgi:hypothetical protein